MYEMFPFTIVCFTPSIQTVKLYPSDETVMFMTSPTLVPLGTTILISGVILSITSKAFPVALEAACSRSPR